MEQTDKQEREERKERAEDMARQDRVIAIAKVCYEANKALCETQGDESQPTWDDTPAWQKNSAVNGVKFHLLDHDAPASASHENWLKEKVEAGWVFGPTKDPEKKEHPCCVPFDELPADQQLKDHLFKAIVGALHHV